MADFRRGTTGTNYLSRGEQRRLLLMVLMLGLVIYLMHQAAQPQNWHWLWRGEVPVDQPAIGEADTPAPGQPIDTRWQPPGDPPRERGLGEFHAPLDPDPLPPNERHFPGLRAELLETVRDDTIFRGAEHEAWFHLWQLLSEHSPSQLREASTGRASFAQLFQQTELYRGELVTVRGTMRRAIWKPAARNQVGIEGYYQTWLQPDDSPTTPLVVYCLALPESFPRGEDIRAEVAVTGFVFKRWAYEAQDAIRIAPVLLARTVDWSPPVVRREPPPNLAGLIALVLAAAAGSGLLLYLIVRRDRTPPPMIGQQRFRIEPGTSADEDTDVRSNLQRMSEETT